MTETDRAPEPCDALTDDALDDIAVIAGKGNLYDLRIAIEAAHPAHDDTALLRMALGQLECNTENMRKGMSKSIQKLCARENIEAITALNERLGEKV